MEKGDITSSQIVGIVIAVLVIVLAVMLLLRNPAQGEVVDESALRSECLNWQRFNYASAESQPGTFNKDNYSNLWKKFISVKLDADKKPIDPTAPEIASGALQAKAYCTWQKIPDCTIKDGKCGDAECDASKKCQAKSDNSGCDCVAS